MAEVSESGQLLECVRLVAGEHRRSPESGMSEATLGSCTGILSRNVEV